MIDIYDIETIVNCFTYCSINRDTLVENEFVIHNDRNDLWKLMSHLTGDCMINKPGLKGMIGFNNQAFDGQVIQFIIENCADWLDFTGGEVANIISRYANKVIEKANKGAGQWSDYPDWKMTIPQCDLFKIMHFDNKAKMTSLKWVEYMINMNSIEEMPIHYMTEVTIDQVINQILPYNKHDVKATFELYKIIIGDTDHPLYKGVDKIQLRKDIQRQFGIKCINYNDVKIGDELNKLSYCKIKGINKQDIQKSNKDIISFKFKDCFPSYMKFETQEFNNFVNSISDITVNLKKSKEDKQVYEFGFNGTIYTIAKGGIHSKDKPRIIQPNDNEILRDADIGSQYPNSIRKRKLFPKHLGEEWLIGYTNTIQGRIDAKKSKKNAIAEAFKLALNGGGFGKTNEEFNWQYDPFITYSVTIGNQIEILMLIEDLELAGIRVASANTDGIVCLFDKSKDDIYYKICKNWEKQVGNDTLGQLEYCDYSKLIQTSVNDYIAIKLDGKIKTKGDFVSEFELHKNKSRRIVPLALQAYFTKGYPIDKFIKEHTNIFDFCLGVKSIGKNRLIAIDVKKQQETILQKINRYYISTDGINLIKKLPKLEKSKPKKQLDIFGNISDDSREQEVEAGWLSTIYNKHEEKDIKDYNIDYRYYIQSCERIINQIIN